MMQMIERRTLEDIHEIATFQLYPTKFKVTYRKNPVNKRIVAEVEGAPEDIERVFQGIADNASVGVLDFIRSLRKVKTQIFGMKDAGQ